MAEKNKSKSSKKEQFSDLLLQVNNDLAVTNTLDEALETLVGITTSIIKCERGTIFLNDPKSEELYSRVAQGNFMREIRFMNTKGVAGWSYTNKKGVIVHDAYKDERFNKNVDIRTGFRTKSILSTPLCTVSGKTIGVSQLLNKIDEKFSDSDLLGFPFQIIVGPQGLKDNVIEIKDRKLGKVNKLSSQEIVNFVANQFSSII